MTGPAVAAAGIVLEDMKKHRGLLMVLGILLMLVGIGALAMPVASSMAITLVLGWMFIFGGIMQVIFAIQTRTEVGTGGTILNVLLSLVWVGAGM